MLVLPQTGGQIGSESRECVALPRPRPQAPALIRRTGCAGTKLLVKSEFGTQYAVSEGLVSRCAAARGCGQRPGLTGDIASTPLNQGCRMLAHRVMRRHNSNPTKYYRDRMIVRAPPLAKGRLPGRIT